MKENYSDFHYRIVKPTEPGYVRVEVTFKYKGLSTKHYIFLDEKEGTDYISEAKKQVGEAILKENFEKVAHRYHPSPKKVLGFTFLILALTAAIGAPIIAKMSIAVPTLTVEFQINNAFYPTDHLIPEKQSVLYHRTATEPIKGQDFTSRFPYDDSYVYQFKCWTLNPAPGASGAEPYNFSSPVINNITLYATWIVVTPNSL